MVTNKLLLAVFSALLLLSPAQGEQSKRACHIKSFVGDVKVRKADFEKLRPARVGMVLRNRDALSTAVESKAVIEMSDGTLIKVGESSVVRLSELLGEENVRTSTSVKIFYGNVLTNVKKLCSAESRFVFETPTATASIRGTKIGFRVTKTKTDMRVYEGKVFFKPKTPGAEGKEVSKNEAATESPDGLSVVIEKFEGTFADVDPEMELISGSPQTAKGENKAKNQKCGFALFSPTESVRFFEPDVSVRGKVRPEAKVVAVIALKDTESSKEGKKIDIPVEKGGIFSRTIQIGPDVGFYVLRLEVTCGDTTTSTQRMLEYAPPNPDVPKLLGPAKKAGKVCFGVKDSEADDEITFHWQIGAKEMTEKGTPGSEFCIDFLEGEHVYAAYAEDNKGNMSTKWSERIPYLRPGSWSIEMRRPTNNETVKSSELTSVGANKWRYEVQFTIIGLPSDNPSLLQAIEVENRTTYKKEELKPPRMTQFSMETEVKTGNNRLEITVRDINSDTQKKQFIIKVEE